MPAVNVGDKKGIFLEIAEKSLATLAFKLAPLTVVSHPLLQIQLQKFASSQGFSCTRYLSNHQGNSQKIRSLTLSR